MAADDSIRARAARVLGWTEAEVGGFSLAMLREMVKVKDPALAAEISRALSSGSHLVGEPLPGGPREDRAFRSRRR